MFHKNRCVTRLYYKFCIHNKENQLKITKQRTCSTYRTNVNANRLSEINSAMTEEKEQYKLLPFKIINFVTNEAINSDIKMIRELYKNLLGYNFTKNLKLCETTTVAAYKQLEDQNNVNHESLKLANILGLCVEMLRSSVIIVHDMSNNSDDSRNVSSWYKCDNVGLNAINHARMIENSIYYVLHKYFGERPFYTYILDTFGHVAFQLYTGLTLEAMCSNKGKPHLELHSMKVFNAISKCKNSSINYYLPIILASHLADKYNDTLDKYTANICSQIGILFQARVDFNSYLFDSKSIDKQCDISLGRSTWNISTILKDATPDQRNIIKQYYGQSGPKGKRIIEDLYEKNNISERYYEYEKCCLENIHAQIQQLSDESEQKLFYSLLHK